jgi:hypothetical protein
MDAVLHDLVLTARKYRLRVVCRNVVSVLRPVLDLQPNLRMTELLTLRPILDAPAQQMLTAQVFLWTNDRTPSS